MGAPPRKRRPLPGFVPPLPLMRSQTKRWLSLGRELSRGGERGNVGMWKPESAAGPAPPLPAPRTVLPGKRAALFLNLYALLFCPFLNLLVLTLFLVCPL